MVYYILWKSAKSPNRFGLWWVSFNWSLGNTDIHRRSYVFRGANSSGRKSQNILHFACLGGPEQRLQSASELHMSCTMKRHSDTSMHNNRGNTTKNVLVLFQNLFLGARGSQKA